MPNYAYSTFASTLRPSYSNSEVFLQELFFSLLCKFVSNFVYQTKSVSKGTLIFWDGHVGVMINETEVVHSNMYHLGVHIEKLSNTIKRVGKVQKLKQIKI